MPRYQLDLTIPEWEADNPLVAVESFLELAGGPDWSSLVFTVTDLQTGEPFGIVLKGRGEKPDTYLVVADGEKVPVDFPDMEELEDAEDVARARAALAAGEPTIPWDQVKADPYL